MKLIVASSLCASAAAALCIVSAQASAPKPKLSAHDASRIAARAEHGVARSARYEHEDGRWQYAVIVARGKSMFEVEVDPTTGKVLDSEKTSAAEETRERASDNAKAMGSQPATGKHGK
jgi:L-aminopeptidase/D-esterase-like protein